MTIIALTLLTLKEPYILRDPDNFTPANHLVTPVQIQPGWYFLIAYAILRSIPNKLGGIIALAIPVEILFIIPTNKSKFRGTQFYPINKAIFWTIIRDDAVGIEPDTATKLITIKTKYYS